jgi:protein ImuA
MSTKAEILAGLRREISSLQGYRPASLQASDALGLGPICEAFPNGVFPQAALHEFLCANMEEGAASAAFISGLLAKLMQGNGVALWIGTSRTLYPPALKAFGIRPEAIIFLDLKKEKEVCWALEEALKCGALSAVVGELKELSFTESRRIQLAIESSGVPCFVLRRNARAGTTTAVTRWQVRPAASSAGDMPGIGHPRWQVQLLRVRNGRAGSWNIEWVQRSFREVKPLSIVHSEPKRKAG